MKPALILAAILAPFSFFNLSAATFVVTSTANSGPGTLRQAILDANTTPGFNDGNVSTGSISVSWPSAAALFVLEETPSLTPPIKWTSIASGITDDGQTRTFSVLVTSATNSLFFRLQR